MTSMYKSLQYQGQCAVCTEANSIIASMYKSVQYHGQCVQEHTAS